MNITTKFGIGDRCWFLGWRNKDRIEDDKIDTIFITINNDGTKIIKYILVMDKTIMGQKPEYREGQLHSSREELIESL